MIHKFKRLSKEIFASFAKIHKVKSRNRNEFEYSIGVTKLLDTFQNLDIVFGDPPIPLNGPKIQDSLPLIWQE
ncbi:MAG: hypothetical protein QMD36_02470 [Candidatus Aenigmarchaeota archaeon]|nr:hypothetical protein [Candidatus Aenigmarchaeota archaeon]